MNKFKNIQGNRRGNSPAMFWKEGVKVEILSLSSNHIDVLIANENEDEKWKFIRGVYDFSESQMKHKTCELIDLLALVVF